MRRPPTAYVLVLVGLVAIGTLVTLTYFAVPPFDNPLVWILTNVVSFLTLLVLGVVGGAFVGMLLAHRIMASRQFTPFERQVMQSLEDIRSRLDDLEKRGFDELRARR